MALTQMLGNIISENLVFIADCIASLLPVYLRYEDVMTSLKAQSIILKDNRISTCFDSIKIGYEKSTKKVFIFSRYTQKHLALKKKEQSVLTNFY